MSKTYPYFSEAAGTMFHSAVEENDYWARVAQRDANLAGGTSAQSVLSTGAVDVRELASIKLLEVAVNINTLLNRPDLIGPTAAMHILSAFVDYGIQDRG